MKYLLFELGDEIARKLFEDNLLFFEIEKMLESPVELMFKSMLLMGYLN